MTSTLQVAEYDGSQDEGSSPKKKRDVWRGVRPLQIAEYDTLKEEKSCTKHFREFQSGVCAPLTGMDSGADERGLDNRHTAHTHTAVHTQTVSGDLMIIVFSGSYPRWVTSSGIAALILFLLCILLLAGIIGLSVHYNKVISRYNIARSQSSTYIKQTEEKYHFKAGYNNLTKERDQLKLSYNNLTKERDQLKASNNNLTEERDQLKVSYNNLIKERDHLKVSNTNLTEERDQLKASNNNLTEERDQLKVSYTNLTERDQLEASNKNLTEERDQLKISYIHLTKERDHLKVSYTNLTEERDKLKVNQNNLTEERDQLKVSYNNLIKERDHLKISYTNLTEESDQVKASYNNLTEERDQLKASYNHLTKERDQLKASYRNLTEERDQLNETLNLWNSGWKKFGSSWYFLSKQKNTWTASREDCLKRGAHLVIINSEAEQRFIYRLGESLSAHIGLHDMNTEGDWEWVDDGPSRKSSTPDITFWNDGEPNNSGGEDCAEIVTKAKNPLKSWNDIPCSKNINWVCEKTPSAF
uniref:C-type lectin domain-containing protein n=1 Tax=Esox lucius TaxID=8010 RepID=A0A6Q2Z8W0_ESOLU